MNQKYSRHSIFQSNKLPQNINFMENKRSVSGTSQKTNMRIDNPFCAWEETRLYKINAETEKLCNCQVSIFQRLCKSELNVNVVQLLVSYVISRNFCYQKKNKIIFFF